MGLEKPKIQFVLSAKTAEFSPRYKVNERNPFPHFGMIQLLLTQQSHFLEAPTTKGSGDLYPSLRSHPLPNISHEVGFTSENPRGRSKASVGYTYLVDIESVGFVKLHRTSKQQEERWWV